MNALCSLGIAIALVAISEVARTAVARTGRLAVERYPLRVMKLPGRGGSLWVRGAAILVGPIAMYLAISALAFGVNKFQGIVDERGADRVGRVIDGYDAVGKVAPGDRIVEVDATPFERGSWELSRRVNDKHGAPVTLTIERDGGRHPVTIRPTQIAPNTWRLGIVLEMERVTDTGLAARRAIMYPVMQVKLVFGGFVDILVGSETADPGGPMRIVSELRGATEPFWARALRSGMLLGTFALLGLALLDLVRLVVLAIRR